MRSSLCEAVKSQQDINHIFCKEPVYVCEIALNVHECARCTCVCIYLCCLGVSPVCDVGYVYRGQGRSTNTSGFEMTRGGPGSPCTPTDLMASPACGSTAMKEGAGSCVPGLLSSVAWLWGSFCPCGLCL